jgi:thiosulfate dehydrogenase [quinone] large subunit
MWGLTLIGTLLLLGLFTRHAAVVGAILVLLYYLFAPPFLGLEYSKPAEGSYLIVNKNLIEACALWILYALPTSHIIGLDRFFIFTRKLGDDDE